MATILFTGFPGFIGRRLVAALLKRDPDSKIVCLVQSKFLSKARQDADSLSGSQSNRLRIIEGDIADPKLGLLDGLYQQLAQEVIEVWHLAAIYDLAVPKTVAHKVNVEGTIHVLNFSKACQNFDKLVYFSTCYVGGKRTGLVKETDLSDEYGFKNFYESTKYLAEGEVKKAMAAGLRAIVIRPSIAVGDSKTGETDKFDGPYFGMELIYKLRWLPMGLPRLGPSLAPANLVPVDYLVDASVALSQAKEAIGLTFQLADPKPMRSVEIYDLLCQWITGKPSLSFSIPPKLMEFALTGPGRQLFGVPKEVLIYFNHDVTYDCVNATRLLAPKGIVCPAIKDYLPVLYKYWFAHRGNGVSK